MNNYLKLGINNAAILAIGVITGCLVSRKIHLKKNQAIADEIMGEVVPSMFQTMTLMLTSLREVASMDFSSEDEFMGAYEKTLADGFEFFNLTMKDKYGVQMQLEIHKEPREEE